MGVKGGVSILLTVLQISHALVIEFLPSKDQYLLEGDSLNLSCIVTGTSHSTPGVLSIMQHCTRDCSNHHAVRFTEHTVGVVIKSVNLSDAGTYECKWNESMNMFLSVKIGYPPEKPELFCYSIDLKNMTCEVKEKFNPLATDWSLFFSTGFGMVECLGLHKTQHLCEWYSYHDPGYTGDERSIFQFNTEAYYITVTIRNIVKSENFSFTVKPTGIVKPSKIVNLRHGRINSRHVTIFWDIQPLVTMFDIEYRVTIKSKWENDRREIIFHNRGNVSLAMELKDMLPHTAYSITVRCKPTQSNDIRYWSEPSTVEVVTDTDVPGAAPLTIPGAYHIPKQPAGNKTLLTYIYLQSVPEIMYNSDNIFYKIFVNSTRVNDTSITYTILGTPVTAKIYIQNDAVDYCRMSITACNERGCTTSEPITIAIPSIQRQAYPKATEVTVESYRSDHYLISWSLDDPAAASELDKVVYIWCRANNSDGTCYRDVSWKEVTSDQQNTSIMTSYHRDLVFGVSLIYRDGISPGISFSVCSFIIHDGDTVPLRPTFELMSRTGRIVLYLLFSFCDSESLRSKPEFYRIYYKKATSKYNCTQGANVMVVKAMRNITEVTIHSVDSAQYSVCMEIVARRGTSPVSDVHYITLLQGSESGIQGFSEQIIIYIFGVVFAIGIIAALMRYFYTKWKWIDAEIEDISIPVHHTRNEYHHQDKLLPNGGVDRDSGLIDTSGESDKEAMVKMLQTHLPYVSVDDGSFSDLLLDYRGIEKTSTSLNVNEQGHFDDYVLATLECDGESQQYIPVEDSLPTCIVFPCLIDHLNLAGDASTDTFEETSGCNESVTDPVYSMRFKVESDSSSSSSSSLSS